MSGTRRWVNAFAREMETKLAANRHKGDRDGWQRMSAEWLLGRLRQEVDELSDALTEPRDFPDKRVVSEAADVANFAMMIADVAGGLKLRVSEDANGS